MGTLDGKVALVTGAARGQGRSHAIKLAEEGAAVVAVDIAGATAIPTMFYPLATAEDLDQTVKEIEAIGGTVLARECDVRSSEQLDAVIAETKERFGRLDVVAANAGIATNFGKTWEMTEAEWQDVIGVNLTGVWRTTKAAIPLMIEAGNGGSITLTSSLAGLHGYSNIANYVAAKHGVNGLMRTLANELGPYGIRVNTVCPGLINTAMMMNQPTYDLFRPELTNPTQEDATEVFRSMQVLPTKWLEPRDVSEVIAWLASDAARFITGIAVPVDGGQLGRG